MKQDGSIEGLIETLCDTFGFVEEAQPLGRVRTAELQISCLVKQTLDCAYFLRAFTKTPSFCKFFAVRLNPSFASTDSSPNTPGSRAVKNRFIDIDAKIAAYQKAFSDLRTLISTSSAVRTEVTVNRVLRVVEIAENIGDTLHISE